MGEETEKLLSSTEPLPPEVAAPAPATTSDDGEAPPPPALAEEKSPAEKIIEEASATADEQEEKLAEAVENAEEKAVVENRELIPPVDVEEPIAPPFVEESYHVKDLKESEKKALQDLKSKIAEAIMNNTFLAPPPKAAAREGDVEKPWEEEKKVDEVKAEMEDGTKEEKKEAAPEGEVSSNIGEAPPSIETPLSIDPLPTTTTETPVIADADEVAVATPLLVPEVAPLVEEVGASPVEEEKTIVPSTLEEVEPPPSQDRDLYIEAEAEDEFPSLEDLSLWGVPLLHTKGDERTDVILLKFLRARDFKVNDAMSMLKDTVVWRQEFEADNLIGEEIATEFDSVAYMHGVDKEGHPVCYNHYGVFQDKELYQKTFGDEAQFKKFLRWRIQVLERGMQKLDFSPSGVHSMVQVIDLKDSPGFVKRRNITKKAFAILQDNYPELVAKQIFVNVPWYFGALYSLHGKFITARSKSKVVVARPEKVTETLFKYISPENLPVHYGGFGRPHDTDFEGVEAPVQEVTLKAGEKQTIELPEQEVGSTLVWDVVVVGWEVIYGEEFVPSGEGKYTVIIQKPKKVTAAEEPLRNSFKATTDAGKVVITIDNISRRKKLVVLRHTIKKNLISER